MNQIDFNKEFNQPIQNKDECFEKKEQWKKYIQENELQGFFVQKKTYKPNGIIFHYDVEAVKHQKRPVVKDQLGEKQ